MHVETGRRFSPVGDVLWSSIRLSGFFYGLCDHCFGEYDDWKMGIRGMWLLAMTKAHPPTYQSESCEEWIKANPVK